MSSRTPLLLCHEMEGFGGQDARHGCIFDIFFANPAGEATPAELLRASIYSTIATPLKGGAFREVSRVMVILALSEMVGRETVSRASRFSMWLWTSSVRRRETGAEV